MAEDAHKNFFATHKALAFLPLLLVGAGVWYLVDGRHRLAARSAAEAPAPEAFGDNARPAAVPAAPELPKAKVLPEAYDPKLALDIQGSEEFKSQVTHALKLIWMADRDTFLFVKNNLSVIRSEDKTGFYPDNGRAVAALSNANAFRSLTWCAGIIAHQAWHAWYYAAQRRKTRPAPPLPGEAYDRKVDSNPMRVDYKGMDAILYMEDKAFAFQLDVLKKVGAPSKETGPVLRRAPRDFSGAHDGNYELKP